MTKVEMKYNTMKAKVERKNCEGEAITDNIEFELIPQKKKHTTEQDTT